jgi:AcrR family transcriptional regulator
LRREGVAGTTTRAILSEAGISRGAMYHHFASLEDLIAAVYEDEAAGAIERAVARRKPNDSPIEDLLATCLAWLDELSDPGVARVLAVDGPAALGWERCRDIEAAYSLAQMRAWLEAATRAGEIEIVSADLVARILNASLTEAALSIVRSRKKRRARADAEVTLRQLVSGLRTPAN